MCIIGDSRVNINPYVTTLYTIFLRSHNRIAAELKRTKSWKDERLFDTARRINTAIYQKIVYEEWARVIVGKDVMDGIMEPFHSSRVATPAVSNEFATAAIRFYYSMMPGDLSLERVRSFAPLESNVIERLRYMDRSVTFI